MVSPVILNKVSTYDQYSVSDNQVFYDPMEVFSYDILEFYQST